MVSRVSCIFTGGLMSVTSAKMQSSKLDASLDTRYELSGAAGRERLVVIVKCLAGATGVVASEIRTGGGQIDRVLPRLDMIIATIDSDTLRSLVHLDEVRGIESDQRLPLA